MNRYIFAIFSTILVLCSGSARADFDLKSYNELKQHDVVKDKLNDYTTGVGRGIFWANARLGARGDKKIFCMPPKLSLDEGLIQSLLDQEIRAPVNGVPYSDSTPIEFIMLRAFELRFPCDDSEANNSSA